MKIKILQKWNYITEHASTVTYKDLQFAATCGVYVAIVSLAIGIILSGTIAIIAGGLIGIAMGLALADTVYEHPISNMITSYVSIDYCEAIFAEDGDIELFDFIKTYDIHSISKDNHFLCTKRIEPMEEIDMTITEFIDGCKNMGLVITENVEKL